MPSSDSAVASASGQFSGERRLRAFVDELVQVSAMDEAFNAFIVHRPDLDRANLDVWTDEWTQLLRQILSESASGGGGAAAVALTALQELVSALSTLASRRGSHPKTLHTVCALLERSVADPTLPAVTARLACDALLKTDKLHYDNLDFWREAFRLVRNILSGVDYKGVREIMKICIDKVITLPAAAAASTAGSGTARRKKIPAGKSPAHLRPIQQLLEYIFDREAALLPGYFIVNEILKSYPENPNWPHWSLVPMVSGFLDSFRPTAQMVSSVHRHRMRPVVELTGRAHALSVWRLDSGSLKFLLKGSMTYDRILPYGQNVTRPQHELLRDVLRQEMSKGLVNSMLGLQKPTRKEPGGSGAVASLTRCPTLEQELAHMFIVAMKEAERGDTPPEAQQLLWANLASELISFVLFQFFQFSTFMSKLLALLREHASSAGRLRAGRDQLMWALLQLISGSIAKNALSEFADVLHLITYLYDDETEPLAVPDVHGADCVRRLAATAIYVHVSHKANNESVDLHFGLPVAFHQHYQFLTGQLVGKECDADGLHQRGDFSLLVQCNTFSTVQDVFQPVMTSVGRVIGTSSSSSSSSEESVVGMPGGCKAFAVTEPLSMDMIDSLTVHTKMSIMHHIVTFIGKQMAIKSRPALAPALVENYCRLLVYTEVESLGIKGLINQLLPQMFKQGAWDLLHVVLEIFSYRLHHIQTNFRTGLLSHLQVGMVGGGDTNHHMLTNHAQLNLCVESATLKLITGLGNSELCPPKGYQPPTSTGGSQQQQQQQQANKGSVLYGENEELNRVLVLTLARSIHVNGLEQQTAPWLKETLSSIMLKTPHGWPSHTLQNFPPLLQDFFKDNPGPKENKATLKKLVDDEYKVWQRLSASPSTEAELIQHFVTRSASATATTTVTPDSSSLFLCILWKMLLETDQVTPVAYKVLAQIGSKRLASHLRSFCDMLVCEFSKSGGSGHLNKCIEAMNNLIWKYNVIALDRLILCMALRTNEGNEAQVCFFIIQLLLLKPDEFRNRVSELVRTMSPEHQAIKDFHKMHLEFHEKFPEHFRPTADVAGAAAAAALDQPYLPTYFGNVCLRFIPVFDVVVHRFLELPPVAKSLETLIDHVGKLYKFHDKPITYLYNTLHYFERRVRERPSLKRKLISNITGALKEVRPADWCLTDDYQDFLGLDDSSSPSEWDFGADYFARLVARHAQAMQGRRPFPHMDYRFNEFPNEGAHATYVTCVEIMGLPMEPAQVGGALLNVVLQSDHCISPEDLPDWINSIGILVSYLPEAYWDGLTQKLVAALSSPPLTQWTLQQSPFKVFHCANIRQQDTKASSTSSAAATTTSTTTTSQLSLLLALAHSVFHHAGFTQIQTLPDLIREKLLPLVKTEEQLLYVLHLAGPFLQRLHTERYMRPLFDLNVQFYRMLHKVDKEARAQGPGHELRHADAICDILYHVKYQFTGDSVKSDAERIVRDLSAPLQLRLRFIAPGIVQQQQQTTTAAAAAGH